MERPVCKENQEKRVNQLRTPLVPAIASLGLGVNCCSAL